MSSRVDIADVVARVMRDAGASQQDLADAAGVTSKQIGRWAAGGSNPPERKVARAVQRLGLDPRAYGLRPAPDVGVAALDGTTAPAWALQQFEQLRAQLDEMQLVLERIDRRGA